MWTAEQEFLSDEHSRIYEETADIAGWQLPGDSFRLYEMGYRAGAVILEIGTFAGRSAVVELRGALANPTRTKLPQFFGIDVDFTSVLRTIRNLEKAGLNDHALVYHGTLEQFISRFNIQPTMVFVDGDHRYEGIKNDLNLLTNFLSPGVPILCHDYLNPENDTGEIGVRQAVSDFVADGYGEMIGTFGCSAFLMTTDRCSAPSGSQWSAEQFAQQRADLLWNYIKELFLVEQYPEQQSHQETDVEQVFKSVQVLKRELEAAQNIITAMKTSKFWRLRTAWFKVKRSMGIMTLD